MKSSREVHLDAILAPIIDFNAVEQITNSRPFHLNAPFFFHLECQVQILRTCTHLTSTLLAQLPLYYDLANPLDGIALHYHFLGQVL